MGLLFFWKMLEWVRNLSARRIRICGEKIVIETIVLKYRKKRLRMMRYSRKNTAKGEQRKSKIQSRKKWATAHINFIEGQGTKNASESQQRTQKRLLIWRTGYNGGIFHCLMKEKRHTLHFFRSYYTVARFCVAPSVGKLCRTQLPSQNDNVSQIVTHATRSKSESNKK